MLNREEIDLEVARVLKGPQKRGLREHMMAYLIHINGHTVDVRCPNCQSVLVVESFPMNNGHNISCECGTCSGSLKAL